MIPAVIELPNGLRVAVVHKDGPPLVSVSVAYHVGSSNEMPGKTGYAHLFEHLMFDNFRSNDGKTFDQLVTEAGGVSNAYTTYDWTYYHMTLPVQAWKLGLELEAERMRECIITETALETQRRVVLEEIAEQVFNQPYGTARMLVAQSAYSTDSCYAWDVYGSPDDLRAMTLDDVHQWYWQYYRPNNAVLCVSGAIDSTTDVLEHIAEVFGTIPPAPSPQSRCALHTTSTHHREHDPTLPADMLIGCYHCPSILETEAWYTAEMLALVLSAGRSSPVVQQFVYEQHLAHHASCSVDAREHGSLFEVSMLARTKDITADDLLENWQRFLAQFLAQPLAPEHLERARNKLRRRFAQAFQTTEGLSEAVSLATLLVGDPDRPWKELDLALSISAEAIMEFAHTLFSQSPAIVQYVTR